MTENLWTRSFQGKSTIFGDFFGLNPSFYLGEREKLDENLIRCAFGMTGNRQHNNLCSPTFILNNFCSGSAARKRTQQGLAKSLWASTTHWKFLHSMRSRGFPFTLKPPVPSGKLKTHVILYSRKERSSESDLQKFSSTLLLHSSLLNSYAVCIVISFFASSLSIRIA